MGERLSVNNLYVSSVIPLEEQRPVILKSSIDNLKKKIALVGFMLVNVFSVLSAHFGSVRSIAAVKWDFVRLLVLPVAH